MNSKFPLFAAFAASCVFFSSSSHAQIAMPEQVFVTGSRLGGIRADRLSSSATVLAPADLSARQTRIVSDILRDVPGLAVNRAGPPGQFTQVRIRGAESNHTLVLIDGIEASDPFFGEFDFATLIADEGAKIEVLRGEQSTLYGSDAIGGVIHYITATGAEAPGLTGRFEAGSFGAANTTARAAGTLSALDYALTASHDRSDGTADNAAGRRKLGVENSALAGKFSYALTNTIRFKAVGRWSVTDALVNEQDFNFPPGPNYGLEQDGNGSYRNEAGYGLFSGEFELLEGRWKNAVTLQGVDVTRKGFGNSGSPSNARTSGDKGAREKASYATAYGFGSASAMHTLSAVFDWERETFQNTDPFGFADTSRRHSDTLGLGATYDVAFEERLSVGGGFRYDRNYRFADDTTYRVEARYRFDGGLSPHAAIGSGVKAPTIYQLYGFTPGPGGFIGNAALKPETSEGWEAGLDQTFLAGRAMLGLTYFNSQLKDEVFISYVPPSFAASPQNATLSSDRQGVEASLSARLSDSLRAELAYTYLDALENGQAEVRRPPHVASVNLSWRATGDRYGLNATLRYNGAQQDLRFTPAGTSRVTLDAFTLVNLGADYRMSERWQIYGRVENLLATRYEEVFSFRPAGRSFFAGIKATMS